MATWKSGGKRGLPINLTKAWDGDSAKSRVWGWAGWDGNESPGSTGGKTRQAFLLYDADAPDKKGAYSLPFCDVIDGTLTALATGCRAAASRLPQKDGVSDEERTKARAVLDDYFKRIEDMQRAIDNGATIEEAENADRVINVSGSSYEDSPMDEIAALVNGGRAMPTDAPSEVVDSVLTSDRIASPSAIEVSPLQRIEVRAEDIQNAREARPIPRFTFESGRSSGSDEGDSGGLSIFEHPASVRAIDVRAKTDLLALAKERAFSPELLDSNPPFFWGAEISSTRVDAYFTRMAISTLKNYAAEAKAGISFQNSHNTRELGIGRSLTGRFFSGDMDSPDNPPRVEASFFTIPGLRAGNISTEQFMTGVQVGLYQDVSVGFYGGTMRCSICTRDIWDWDCMHVPGFEYDLRDEAGEKTGKRELAIAWIEDAHLAEVSIVYDGATPGAAILKAQQEAEAGRLRPAQARAVEARYRIKLPGAARRYAGVDVPSPHKEVEMGGTPEARDTTGATAPASDEAQLAPATNDAAAAEGTPELSAREVIAAAVGVTEAEDAARATSSTAADEAAVVEDTTSLDATQQAAVQEERSPVEAIFEPAPAAAASDPVVEATPAPAVAATATTGANGVTTMETIGEPQRSNASTTVSSPPVTLTPDPAIAEMASVRAALAEVGVPVGVDAVRAIRGLAQRVLELTPRAKDGEQYRVDLIEDTLSEGVRAHGAEWDPSNLRAVLQGASLEQVKAIRADFRSLALKVFPGGRATTEPAADPSALEALEENEGSQSATRSVESWFDEELPSAAFAG